MSTTFREPVEFRDVVTFAGGANLPANAIKDVNVDPSAAIARDKLALDSLMVHTIPMSRFRVWDAATTNLPATSSADDLGLYSGTFGSAAPVIGTGDVKNTSVTRYARVDVVLPAEYEDGETVTIRVHGGMQTTVASASATVDIECYKSDKEQGAGSDLCTTAAQSINSTTFADKDFTITPTGLVAGDTLDIRLTIAVVDSATGTAVDPMVGAVQLLCDKRG